MAYLIYKHTLTLDCEHKGWSYIGQTVQAPSRRWRNGTSYKDQIFGRAVEKYGWSNFSHEILVDNIATVEEANKLEEFYIQQFHTYVYDPECRGYNISPGGYNRDNYGKSVYQLDKNKNIVQKFNSISEAARAVNTDPSRISRCCAFPDKHKYAAGYFWCYPEAYESFSVQGFRNKQIYQLDEHKNILNKFNSIAEAGEFLGKAKSNNISLCLSGTKQTAYGYYWCEAANYDNFQIELSTYRRRIKCVTTNTIYKSVQEAARVTGIEAGAIYRAAEGASKSAGNLQWSYI